MWQRQKTLARLYDELNTIEVFDRVHDYATDPDPADNHAYASRQVRRAQVMAEIKKLEESKSRISSALTLLCAAGSATLHYLFK